MQQHHVQLTAHCGNLQGVMVGLQGSVFDLQVMHCLKNIAAGLMVCVNQPAPACNSTTLS